jgi:hypothetical protein
MHYSRTLIGVMLLSLMLLQTGCARVSVAHRFIPCEHPVVDVATHGGLALGLLDYADAVDTCNTLNGGGYVPTT